ncbi:septal ring lytic transglycosylase RlpA family protein [Benzoatithermus flavus]|uniref:Endolytic peptidoglycan transglycosylase RlpA n=1 Tax=Benzoatithermus flavus TaxID=3108223 RepID=A0ABU8XS53_9PROT
MRRSLRILSLTALLAATAAGIGHAAARPETGQAAFAQVGVASWYGPGFHGRRTASGEPFDQDDLTAAHRDLPLGSEVTVTNLENGRSIVVQINDRGPYVKGRVIDLSKAAARRLGIIEEGVAKVRIEATPQQLALAER